MRMQWCNAHANGATLFGQLRLRKAHNARLFDEETQASINTFADKLKIVGSASEDRVGLGRCVTGAIVAGRCHKSNRIWRPFLSPHASQPPGNRHKKMVVAPIPVLKR
jgi:hypothetical protein